jgi:hypothetical protein
MSRFVSFRSRTLNWVFLMAAVALLGPPVQDIRSQSTNKDSSANRDSTADNAVQLFASEARYFASIRLVIRRLGRYTQKCLSRSSDLDWAELVQEVSPKMANVGWFET